MFVRIGDMARTAVVSCAVSVAACGEADTGVSGSLSDTAMWSADEQLTIGTAVGDSAYEFSRISEIDVDAHGNIYVWDLGLRRVRKYDEHGRFLVQMGGDGGAPHEFSSSPNAGVPLPLGGMALLGDSLVVVHDPWAPKLVFFDIRGEFHHNVPLHHLIQAARLFERISLRVDDLGDELVLLSYQSPFGSGQSARPWDGRHTLVRMAVDGSSLDTLATFPQQAVVTRPLNDRMSELFQKPFAAEWKWAANASGRIAVGNGSQYAVTIYDRSWDMHSELRRNVPPRPVTGEDVASFRASFPYGTGMDALSPGVRRVAAEVLDEFEMPTSWPFFDRLRYDDAGRLWVRVPPSHGDSMALWTVFDADLNDVATLPLPSDNTVMEIAGDRIYSLDRDELDVNFVRVHRIQKH